MESLKELFVYGPGPSSSHTIGPYKACKDFLDDPNSTLFNRIEVILKGSLALTGKGHLTDKIIKNVFINLNTEIKFDYSLENLQHPNTLLIFAYDKNDKLIKTSTYFSVGGGKIIKDDLTNNNSKEIYPYNSFDEIKKYLNDNNITDLKEFVDNFEDKDINVYLNDCIEHMYESIDEGLKQEGILPGDLKLKRVAKEIYQNALKLNEEDKHLMLLTAFSYSISENNASGNYIVTAPTCGSAGIIPSILYYEEKINKVERSKIIDALKVGGIFGNLAKKNASISGASGGCQAEIGVASAMGAAILAYINNLSIYQIEYASEVALEHFLGLTCDPVKGYVQIPCIERNGIGVLRSYSSYLYSKNIAPLRKNKVSYDEVIETMKITGNALSSSYKETSIGGLAKIIK